MNVLWHTRDEEPDYDGIIAVIAVDRNEGYGPFLLNSTYTWDASNRKWIGLNEGNRLNYERETTFWWCTENDMISTLPYSNVT